MVDAEADPVWKAKKAMRTEKQAIGKASVKESRSTRKEHRGTGKAKGVHLVKGGTRLNKEQKKYV